MSKTANIKSVVSDPMMPIEPLHYTNFDLFKSQNYPSFLHNSLLIS